MLLLVSTSDKITLTTGSAVSSINVHASYIDLNGTTVTPGRNNTLITTATTTDIVLAPAASTYRTVKTITVRNTSTTASTDITINHTDGTTVASLYKVTLGPSGQMDYSEETGFYKLSTIIPPDPWGNILMSCMRDGNPNYTLNQMQVGGNVAPTPTNITTTVARCEMFRPAYDLTVNRIRWYGVGATTNLYTVALYRWSDLSRITPQQTLRTVATAWDSADVTGTILTAGTLYFVAVGTTNTGTTSGIASVGNTIAATTGQIVTTPSNLPGNLDFDLEVMSSYRFQFAVTAGALPTTAATPVAQAAWTGGMPAFFLDGSSAA